MNNQNSILAGIQDQVAANVATSSPTSPAGPADLPAVLSAIDGTIREIMEGLQVATEQNRDEGGHRNESIEAGLTVATALQDAREAVVALAADPTTADAVIPALVKTLRTLGVPVERINAMFGDWKPGATLN